MSQQATMMEALYNWDPNSMSDFSDLDGSWSPGSSGSHYSDQENAYGGVPVQNSQVNVGVDGQSQLTLLTLGQNLQDFGSLHELGMNTYPMVDPGAKPIIHQTTADMTVNANNRTSAYGSRKISSGRNPTRRVHQRSAANQRERKRMKTINDAFEGLRDRIPLACGDRKLSKVDTLRLAIRYIQNLSEMITTCEDPSAAYAASSAESTKVIIRCNQSTGLADYFDSLENPYGGYGQLYGHSLSWESEKANQVCPNNRLSAKVWMPSSASTDDVSELTVAS